VLVRDTTGTKAAGQVVRFVAVPTGGGLALSSVASPVFGAFVAETTNAQGQASVLVRLGPAAGAAHVAVSVPAFGYADSVAFTVLPGHAHAITALPADTTIAVGGSYQIVAAVVDRYGNARSDRVTFVAVDTMTTVSTGGLVTGRAVGNSRIAATLAGVTPDTVTAGVVPAATIAATTAGGIEIVNLDGSGYQTITVPTADYNGRFPSWLTSTSIAAMDGQYYARLLRITTAGAVQYLIPSDTTVVFEVWPQAARDGSWIFFGALVPGYSTSGVSVWRIKPNGDSLTRVSPPNADGFSDTYPSPSPDGTRVAVASTRSGDFQLAVINVATNQLTSLGIAGIAPRWAPAGDSIAYLGGPSQNQIWLVNADGTGARPVSQASRSYAPGMDWSPDRRWIIARGVASLELIEVATGRTIPLAGLPGDPTQPAWKP